MGRASTGGRGRGRRLAVAALMALALVAVFAVVAQSALAFPGWIHGTATSCSACHPGGNTTVPGTDAACQGCHTTQTLRTGLDCWSCHAPGQSVGGVACNSCHLYTGGNPLPNPPTYTIPHQHPAHIGSSLETCTTCHNLETNNPHHSNASVAAPTCTTCHAATPVDSAPVPHAAYVAAKVCVDCHKGVDPNHPLSSAVKTPTLAFTATQPVGGPDVTLKGTLKNGTTALAGVTVYLQSTPDGAIFTDVTSVTTDATGAFTYTVVGATSGLQYRAVTQGVAGPPVVLPAEKLVSVTVPVVKATITLKLTGLTAGKIKVNKTVTGKGTVAPSSVGEKVTLLIQKKNAKGVFVKLTTKTGLLKAGSAYSITYKPTKKGAYRMRSSIPAKAGVHTAATSVGWKTFTVK